MYPYSDKRQQCVLLVVSIYLRHSVYSQFIYQVISEMQKKSTEMDTNVRRLLQEIQLASDLATVSAMDPCSQPEFLGIRQLLLDLPMPDQTYYESRIRLSYLYNKKYEVMAGCNACIEKIYELYLEYWKGTPLGLILLCLSCEEYDTTNKPLMLEKYLTTFSTPSIKENIKKANENPYFTEAFEIAKQIIKTDYYKKNLGELLAPFCKEFDIENAFKSDFIIKQFANCSYMDDMNFYREPCTFKNGEIVIYPVQSSTHTSRMIIQIIHEFVHFPIRTITGGKMTPPLADPLFDTIYKDGGNWMEEKLVGKFLGEDALDDKTISRYICDPKTWVGLTAALMDTYTDFKEAVQNYPNSRSSSLSGRRTDFRCGTHKPKQRQFFFITIISFYSS
eukprot:TRINITY_DN123191_c0_g1_i1.p1 TRINITY_DN123191_c0_g1~~TRINITY_DN123191_c0_g1_i1.p1  ORF type:complete len:427 (+),score=16.10 TRINITY_DN123191_c0_g1_i1:109-1281(+)